MHSFGKKIKKIRKERRLTQKSLSQDICSQSVLSRIENDEELPNVWVMQQLCFRLGVTLDQIMGMDVDDVQSNHCLFRQMKIFDHQKKYRELFELLHKEKDKASFKLAGDLQLYYYYKGCCYYHLYKDYEKALNYFRRSLLCVQEREQVCFTAQEIQIISYIGLVYASMGDRQQARILLQRAVKYSCQMPEEQLTISLVKIFYNFGHFLWEESEYDLAEEQVDRGISWDTQNDSYYYLVELFELKSKLLEKRDCVEQAEEFAQMAAGLSQLNRVT